MGKGGPCGNTSASKTPFSSSKCTPSFFLEIPLCGLFVCIWPLFCSILWMKPISNPLVIWIMHSTKQVRATLGLHPPLAP